MESLIETFGPDQRRGRAESTARFFSRRAGPPFCIVFNSQNLAWVAAWSWVNPPSVTVETSSDRISPRPLFAIVRISFADGVRPA